MKYNLLRWIRLAVIGLMLVGVTAIADPLGTGFTYQGLLKDNGNPANGSYNVDFALWDALSGGSQVGSTIQFINLPITGGLFAIELDFGSSVYDGSQRWLEVTVNGNVLTPRQSLSGSPYSIQTRGVFVDDAGNVGIGTTNPSWEFEVVNPAPGDGVESGVTAEDASGAIAAYSSTLPPPFDHFGGRVSLFGNALDVRADGTAGDIRFYTGGPLPANERMRITHEGNVGIGTDLPYCPLDVHNSGSSGQVLRLVSDQSYGYMRFVEGLTARAYLGYGDDGDLLVNALPNSFAINGLDTAIHFAVDSDAEKGITIDTEGDVSIGATDAPNDLSKLYVRTSTAGSAAAVEGIAVGNSDINNYGGKFSAYGVRGAGVYGVSDSDEGRGVVGSADGDYGRGVYGETYGSSGSGVYGYARGGPDSVGVFGYGFNTWDFYAGGPGGHYGEISSIRWKRNIRNIDNPLEKLARLRGVYFDWDEEHGGQHDMGMIAEEVGKVVPEVVLYEANGIDANGMDYGKLTPLLVEAVNALRAEKNTEIDALRIEKDAEIAELKQRINEMERLIEKLMTKGTEKTQ